LAKKEVYRADFHVNLKLLKSYYSYSSCSVTVIIGETLGNFHSFRGECEKEVYRADFHVNLKLLKPYYSYSSCSVTVIIGETLGNFHSFRGECESVLFASLFNTTRTLHTLTPLAGQNRLLTIDLVIGITLHILS